MIKCKGCGSPKFMKSIGIIWLSKDGYCSVCNHKFKDRTRNIIGMDKFVKTEKIKESNYNHLTHTGGKITDNYILKQKCYNEAKSGGIIAAGYRYRQLKDKGKKKLEDFI